MPKKLEPEAEPNHQQAGCIFQSLGQLVGFWPADPFQAQHGPHPLLSPGCSPLVSWGLAQASEAAAVSGGPGSQACLALWGQRPGLLTAPVSAPNPHSKGERGRRASLVGGEACVSSESNPLWPLTLRGVEAGGSSSCDAHTEGLQLGRCGCLGLLRHQTQAQPSTGCRPETLCLLESEFLVANPSSSSPPAPSGPEVTTERRCG